MSSGSTTPSSQGVTAKANDPTSDSLLRWVHRARLNALNDAAALAHAARHQDLTDIEFRAVVKLMHDHHIVSVERLATLARVDGTTANRWINGRSKPAALTQETILGRIEDEARREAAELAHLLSHA